MRRTAMWRTWGAGALLAGALACTGPTRADDGRLARAPEGRASEAVARGPAGQASGAAAPASPASPVGAGGAVPTSAGGSAPATGAPGGAGAGPSATAAREGGAGHLDGAAALAGFFARLGELDAKTASDDVRIAQLGDSHTASDYGVSVVRRLLAARFGDGGRGFIPLGKPYKRLFQAGEIVSDADGFEPEEGKLVAGGRRAGDGCYGPAGIAMVASRPGARAWSRYSVEASTLEVAYAEAPRGGAFDVVVDDAKIARIETRRDGRAAAFRGFDVAPGAHHVEVRAAGDGEVRVFGVTLGSPARGVVVEALGINGAKVTTPLDWDPAHLAEQMRHRPPALVILAYGTNEVTDRMTPDEHAQHFVELVRRVRVGAPQASCLLLGPPDRADKAGGTWTTMPRVIELAAAQRKAARAAGCAFFDQLAAMGGPGTIDAWARERPKSRARNDHVHLTREGYTALAEALVAELVAAYDAARGGRRAP